jgi:hypothetical protein
MTATEIGHKYVINAGLYEHNLSISILTVNMSETHGM